MQLVCVHEERAVLQVVLAVAGVCEGRIGEVMR